MGNPLIDKPGIILATSPSEHPLEERHTLATILAFWLKGEKFTTANAIAETISIPIADVRLALKGLNERGLFYLPAKNDDYSDVDGIEIKSFEMSGRVIQATLPEGKPSKKSKNNVIVLPEPRGCQEETVNVFGTEYRCNVVAKNAKEPAGDCVLRVQTKQAGEDDYSLFLEKDHASPTSAWEEFDGTVADVDKMEIVTWQTERARLFNLIDPASPTVEANPLPEDEAAEASTRIELIDGWIKASNDRFVDRERLESAKKTDGLGIKVYENLDVKGKDGLRYDFRVTEDSGKFKLYLQSGEIHLAAGEPFDTKEEAISNGRDRLDALPPKNKKKRPEAEG